MLAYRCLLLFCLAALPVAEASRLRPPAAFLKLLGAEEEGAAPKHTLRVCNAYADKDALQVFLADGMQMTSQPMTYKFCEDFTPQLTEGQTLTFKVSGLEVGTFSIAKLPTADATLLLVVSRRDEASMTAVFQSHVFVPSGNNAQLAVIDAYSGKSEGALFVEDTEEAKIKEPTKARQEPLAYDSAVNIQSGLYQVTLRQKTLNTIKDKSNFVALSKSSYVAIRVGLEDPNSTSWAEEVVVYPQSDPAALNPKTEPSILIGFGMVGLAATILITFFYCFFREPSKNYTIED